MHFAESKLKAAWTSLNFQKEFQIYTVKEELSHCLHNWFVICRCSTSAFLLPLQFLLHVCVFLAPAVVDGSPVTCNPYASISHMYTINPLVRLRLSFDITFMQLVFTHFSVIGLAFGFTTCTFARFWVWGCKLCQYCIVVLLLFFCLPLPFCFFLYWLLLRLPWSHELILVQNCFWTVDFLLWSNTSAIINIINSKSLSNPSLAAACFWHKFKLAIKQFMALNHCIVLLHGMC